MCSVYLPPVEPINRRDIENLIEQLPKPFLLLGDFNAHSLFWNDNRSCARGKMIEKVIEESNLALLDKGNPTFFSEQYSSFSHIDLSICTIDLLVEFEWYAHEDLMGSDHYPIHIKSDKPLEVENKPR